MEEEDVPLLPSAVPRPALISSSSRLRDNSLDATRSSSPRTAFSRAADNSTSRYSDRTSTSSRVCPPEVVETGGV